MQVTHQTEPTEARSPRTWASICLAEAEREGNAEARAAFQQLAQEFQTLAEEIDGLADTFGALVAHRQGATHPSRPDAGEQCPERPTALFDPADGNGDDAPAHGSVWSGFARRYVTGPNGMHGPDDDHP